MKAPLPASLELRHPVILAPLGGGPSTPELVAAVSNAGAFGFLAGAYLTPEQITDSVRRLRSLTTRPFGINTFVGGWGAPGSLDATRMLALLKPFHERVGLPAPSVPTLPPDPSPGQLEAILDACPAAFSFTFGIPSPETMARLKERGIVTLGTATTATEARLLERAGVDAILAQGAEAGGHRGTFAGAFEDAMTPTLQLVREISRAVSVPVVATGGIMDGRDIAAALGAGAAAAQLGTAFMACPESGASAAYKRALLAARRDTTVITRAFSGRPARGLTNSFIEAIGGHPDAILPYPVQNQLTRAMRQAAAQKGDPDLLSLWAGQGVGRVRELPAGQLVERLVQELRDAGCP
jgi:nitronate monooxygenase